MFEDKHMYDSSVWTDSFTKFLREQLGNRDSELFMSSKRLNSEWRLWVVAVNYAENSDGGSSHSLAHTLYFHLCTHSPLTAHQGQTRRKEGGGWAGQGGAFFLNRFPFCSLVT